MKLACLSFPLPTSPRRLPFAHNAPGALQIAPLPYYTAQVRIFFQKADNRVPKAQVLKSDFWAADLSDANVVMVYLLPHCFHDVQEKLLRELKAVGLRAHRGGSFAVGVCAGLLSVTDLPRLHYHFREPSCSPIAGN
jgi:hypothetical protein